MHSYKYSKTLFVKPSKISTKGYRKTGVDPQKDGAKLFNGIPNISAVQFGGHSLTTVVYNFIIYFKV